VLDLKIIYSEWCQNCSWQSAVWKQLWALSLQDLELCCELGIPNDKCSIIFYFIFCSKSEASRESSLYFTF